MSILSDKLNEYLLAKKLTPYQLAQNCPFENATLYQYLNGKRPLKKKEHLDVIISILKLTPEEIQQVTEAYEIELIGIDLYRQRQKQKNYFILYKPFTIPLKSLLMKRLQNNLFNVSAMKKLQQSIVN